MGSCLAQEYESSIEATNELAYYIEGLINGAKDFIVEPLGVLLAASRFNTIKNYGRNLWIFVIS